MAGNRTSFSKRQKEQSRLEKRREKEFRKKQRALDRKMQPEGSTETLGEAAANQEDGLQPEERYL